MKTIIGLFDNRAQAERAQSDIAALGIPQQQISMFQQATSDLSEESRRTGTRETKDWWGELKESLGFTFPPEEGAYYREGVRQGGILVSVRTHDRHQDRIVDLLNRHGAVDIEQRAAEWTRSGWSPDREEAMRVPVVEEEVRIGKREVERGGVRIYSHVTEMPVEEEVRLREERITVERRPTDRPVAPGEAPFQEQTIELAETHEEPVVSKSARVTEEVVVKKEAVERTETVRDTVRRTDVEIQSAPSKHETDRETRRAG